jgi:pimeloyl-ACP methyl ester carboxylesterase
MTTVAAYVFAIALAIYALSLAALILLEKKLIFLSVFSRRPEWARDEKIAFSFGLQEGFYTRKKSKTALLWFDGNTDNVWYIPRALAPFIGELPRLNAVDVIALNYRGYGKSGGKPSQAALFADALNLYDLIAKNYDRVFALGRSLGSGVVCYLSSERKLNGAILITPYDSIRAIAKWRFGFLFAHRFIRNPFDSIRYAQNNETPFAILEVSNDRIVPNDRSASLANAVKNLVLRRKIDGVSHAEIATDRRAFDFVENSLERFENV